MATTENSVAERRRAERNRPACAGLFLLIVCCGGGCGGTGIGDPRLAEQTSPENRRSGMPAAEGEPVAAGSLASIEVDYGLSDPAVGIRITTVDGASERMSGEQFEVPLLDEAVSVRLEAVEGLARTRPDIAVAYLEEALKDPAPSVREAAVEVLAHLDHPSARPLLLRARTDADPIVREEAREALYGQGISSQQY